MDGAETIENALNIVFSAGNAVDRDEAFQLGSNRFYFKPGYEYIDEYLGLMALRGYYFSARPAMGQLLLNVNTVTSTFHQPETVFDFMQRTNFRTTTGSKRKRLERHLIGLRVRIMYNRAKHNNPDINDVARRTRTITGFGREAGQQTFTIITEDGGQKSRNVYDHMHSNYEKVVRKGQQQICVNVGDTKGGRQTWFLPEHLHILSEQIYKHKLQDKQVSNMIEFACRRPEENKSLILSEGLPTIGLGKAQLPQGLAAAGISVDTRMLSVPARTLVAPDIQYNAKHPVKPDNGMWTTRGQQFFSTKAGEKAASYRKAHFLSPDIMSHYYRVEHYIRNFLACYGSNGVGNLSNKPDEWEQYHTNIRMKDTSDYEVNSMLSILRGIRDVSQADLFILILPKKNAENQLRYGAFKTVTDQCLGVKSVCLSEERMESSFQKKGFPKWDTKIADAPHPAKILEPYMAGVALKLNLRLGNVNHVAKVDPSNFLKENGTTDTMILGADVLHPGTGSNPFAPSVAAIVASVDQNFAKYRGSMRHQKRGELITDMASMVQERVDAFRRATGASVTRILYFRDGICESQYQDVLNTEVSAIKKGWRNAFKFKPSKELQVTTVLVNKRHHTRFFPLPNQNHDDRTGNCTPGTVVESTITSPYYFDFFLQSHKGLKGTARPAHYFVLENEMKIKSDVLQSITNALCYNYARSQTAVSYAPPAYYADHLAERGKAYLRPLFDGDEQYADMDEEEVEGVIKDMWARGQPKDAKQKDAEYKERKNPWHPDLDDTMFWM